MNFKIKCILLLLTLSGKLFAQSDASSKIILDALSEKFKTNDAVKTDFNITVYNPEIKNKDSQNGVLYLKSNKYKIIFQNQEILSDGKNQWTYLKADNEVQINMVSKDEDALNPAQIFTAYNKGYKTKYNGETKIGTIIYQNIELAPIATKSFFKIKMVINKAKNQIFSLSVFDKNGNIYTYLVKNLVSVKDISDSFFVWDKKKYPNVDLQDLR
ncbi:MAG: outer membrane lipoprotein carrier protein LolA [Sphingobacteriales bacterium]|nr:MAG: outer membrane lipoprotein carrier protein LolA [Sphingobacteriales bacterium]